MSKITCKHCGADDAPYGDARNMWISYHEAWWHRLYWRFKRPQPLSPEQRGKL